MQNNIPTRITKLCVGRQFNHIIIIIIIKVFSMECISSKGYGKALNYSIIYKPRMKTPLNHTLTGKPLNLEMRYLINQQN